MPRRTTKIPDRVIVAPLGWSASRAFNVGLYSRVLVRCLDAFALTESPRWHDEGLDAASRLRAAAGFDLAHLGGIATNAEAALECRLGRWEPDAGDELAASRDEAFRLCETNQETRFGEALRKAVSDHPVGLYERQLSPAIENDVPREFLAMSQIGEHVADLWISRSDIHLGRVTEERTAICANSCSMSLGGQRVLDVLNDKTTAFLRISDTTLSRVGQTDSFGELQDAVVAKSSIDCVLIKNDVHEAPIRRHHSLVNKHPFATFVLLPDHEICGMTMWALRPDPLVLLASDAPSFFPASPATLWGTSLREHCASTVAFINKASVSMISIGKRTGS